MMIDINSHPVWRDITSYKKPWHLFRISLARFYANLWPREKFIGVTGSVGKTTTVRACQEVLKTRYRTLATVPNLDPIFNIPITILKIRPKIDKVILEMGIEYKGEMEFYLSIVRPATAIITRISPAHTEFLGGVQQIKKEKGLLVEKLEKGDTAILNFDDPIVRSIATKTRANVIFFGTNPQKCQVFASDIKIQNWHTVFNLHIGTEKIKIRSALLGPHQIVSLLAAAALGWHCQVPLELIKEGLERVGPTPHRLEVKKGIRGCILIDDCYNSSPVAVIAALDLLKQLPDKRKIVVLGEMKELGRYSVQYHQDVGKRLSQVRPDLIFLGQGDAEYIAHQLLDLGFPKNRLKYNLDNQQLAQMLKVVLKQGDVVLIKGSRAVHLEEVVNELVKEKKDG